MKKAPIVTSPLPPVPTDYQPMPMDGQGAQASPIALRRLLVFLLKYWWIPLTTLLLALGLAGLYAWFQPPVYVSSGKMYVAEQIRTDQPAGFIADLQSFIGTQAELMKNPGLLDQAIETLKASNPKVIPPTKSGAPPRIKVQVTQIPKSAVFDLVASGPEPAYTQALLEALMNQYLTFKRDMRQPVAGKAGASTGSQIYIHETEWREAEQALHAYESSNDVAVLEEDLKLAGGYLGVLKTRLADHELESKLLREKTWEQSSTEAASTNQGPGITDYLAAIAGHSPGAAISQERFAATRELELLKAQRDRLGQNLRPKHPKMIKLNAQIERGERLVETYRKQARDQLAALQQAVRMRIDEDLSALKEQQEKVALAGARLAEAAKLRREVERTRAKYDQAKLLLDRADTSSRNDRESLRISEHASSAIHSHKQQVILLVLAGMMGLALGIGIVMIIAVRDDRFTSLADLKQQLHEQVVGQLPEVARAEGNGHVPLLEIDDPRQTYAESYRNLRSALLFLSPLGDKRPKILLVTSAAQDEGKSTVASNLAHTLAMGGARVLLVDADMRRGALHDLLGKERVPGLTDVLRQPSALARVIQSDAPATRSPRRRRKASIEDDLNQPGLMRSNLLPNLSFLSRGCDVGNPGDLLLSPSLDQILARLRRQYDYVLIDTCPVFAADDATSLAPKVDGTLLVVRNRFSRSGQVREALQLLYQRQARVLGLVFNRTHASAGSYYYYTNTNYHMSVPAAR